MSRQGPRDQEVTNGAAHANLRDSSGNEITPAFSPGTSQQLTATVTTTNRVALGSATSVRIRCLTASEEIRIAFGDSSVAASATADLLIDSDDPPEKFTIPSGVTHMAYVRDSAAGNDVSFNLVLG